MCPRCGNTHPEGAFIKGNKLCPECRKLKTKMDDREGTVKAMVSLMDEIQVGAIEKVSAVSLVSRTVRRLGGEVGLSEMWASQIEEAIRRNPGSQTTLKAIKELKDAIVQVDPVMQGVDQLKQMTDDEIREFAARLLVERMGSSKHALEQLVGEFGYSLVDARETIDGHIPGVPRLPAPADSPDPGGIDAAICSC